MAKGAEGRGKRKKPSSSTAQVLIGMIYYGTNLRGNSSYELKTNFAIKVRSVNKAVCRSRLVRFVHFFRTTTTSRHPMYFDRY